MKAIRLNVFKKILLVSSEFPPGPGGIGNHGYNLAKYFKKNGLDINVMTISDFAEYNETDEFDRKQDFEIERFKRYKSRSKTFYERIKSIQRELNGKEYSHIIFSGRFPLMSSVLLKSYSRKIKKIAIVHGGDVNIENTFELYLVNKALLNSDLVIPVSNFSASKIRVKLKPEKVVIIPNGFDLENIDTMKVTDKQIKNGNLNLLTVGTIWPRKGHHNVLKALPKIISDRPGTKYNIIGRQADLSKVKSFFDDEKLKHHLNMHGQVSNKEKYDILDSNQIFILLSETQSTGDFEGFGIAVIEANYFGLPAIGSRNSGLEDSIRDGVSGVLVDPQNTDEVRHAVATIAENYERYSKAARDWAKEHHWSKIIQRYIKAIEGIK